MVDMYEAIHHTPGEDILFAKYYGNTDLLNCTEFWTDVEKHLHDYNVLLPIEYTPENVRLLNDMLDCKPGVCGECCRYGITPIKQYDIFRIVNSGLASTQDMQGCVHTRQDDNMMFMRGEPAGADCPFLKDNICSIYTVRPDTCWQFPVQGYYRVGDKKLTRYRVKCGPTVLVIRTILKGALSGGDKLLLPNLSIVTKIKEESNGTNTKSDC